MHTLRRQVLLQAFKLFDLLIMAFSFAVATLFFFIVFWTGSSAIAILSRLMLGTYCFKSGWARGQNLSHMLIIGANSRSVRSAKNFDDAKAKRLSHKLPRTAFFKNFLALQLTFLNEGIVHEQ